jgi:hypothetical protein
MGEPIKNTGFPSGFHTEAAILTSRWHPTGLLAGIENNHVRACTAVLLENQRLFSDKEDKAFRDLAIKMIAKVFPQLLVHKIGSVQPLFGPAGLLYYLKFKYTSKKKLPQTEYEKEAVLKGLDIWGGHDEHEHELPQVNLVVESEDVCAKTRKLKTYLGDDFDYTSDVAVYKLAGDLINELNNEHLTDIYNNCGTVAVWDMATAFGDTAKEKGESLYIKLCEISGVIHRKTLRGGTTFFVMSQKHYDKYGQYIDCFHKKVYIPEGWDKGILMGYAGESYMDRGYAYCPYIPLAKTPIILDPDFCPRSGLLTRYGKKLFTTGAKHYARLEIKNDD